MLCSSKSGEAKDLIQALMMLLKTQDPACLKLLLSAFKATENPAGPSNVVSEWAQHRGRTVHQQAGEEGEEKKEAEQHGQ